MNLEILAPLIVLLISCGWLYYRLGIMRGSLLVLIILYFAALALVPKYLFGDLGFVITLAGIGVYAIWAARKRVIFGLVIWPKNRGHE